MFESFCARYVLTMLFVVFATGSRAEGSDIICSNVPALNQQFVSLLAKHLEFEPNVEINPSQTEIESFAVLRTIRLVISGQTFEDVAACAVGSQSDRIEIVQKIQELQSRLGTEQTIHPGMPKFPIVWIGQTVTINGQRFFITVSDDDSLTAAASAVAQAHNVISDECWFDDECLAAAESYWSQETN